MATVEAEDSTSGSSSNSAPSIPPDSPGSSVSSRMQEEYDELLKYAVVVPNVEPTPVGGFPLDGLRDVIFPPRDVTDAGVHVTLDPNEAELAGTANHNQDGGFPVPTGGSTGNNEDHEASESTEDQSTPTPSETSSDARNVRFHNAVHSREVDRFLAAQLFRTPPVALLSDTDSITQLKLNAEQPPSPQVGELLGNSPLASPSGVGTSFSPGMDPDITRMDSLMDQWLGDLKKNVLAEFSHSRIRQMEESRIYVQKEREKHAAEMTSLRNELESMKELLHTYEQSVARKDDVITNLTNAMRKQRDKLETLKTFSEWKIKHNDAKREKVWAAWRSVVENRWRERVERACQAKAQEVCVNLTKDYEQKIDQLNGTLLASREEVTRLHAERERYEDTMKKAFMRGVCALNMEAMSMFQGGEESDRRGAGGTSIDDPPRPPYPDSAGPSNLPPDPQPGGGAGVGVHPTQYLAGHANFTDHLGAPVSVAQEAVFTSDPPGAPPPRVVSCQSTSTTRGTSQPVSTKVGVKSKPGTKPKVVHARITATSRVDSGRGTSHLGNNGTTLAPPMSSIAVERHQPVNKQTIGHATAMRYPRPGVGAGHHGVIPRKVAGQTSGATGGTAPLNAGVQTVKVVQ